MSYKLKYTGEQIDNILDRAVEGGTIDDALALKAPLESPALTGTPTAPTQAEGDDSTKVATTAYADRAADAAEAAAKEYTDRAASALYITDTASGSIASFSDGADGVSMRSVKVAITPVQSGSGDPSPDNVRPISGWTGANVSVTGINVWDEEWELGSISSDTGQNTSATANIRSKNYSSCVPGTSLFFCGNSGQAFAGVRWYDANKTYLGLVSSGNANNVAITVPDNAYYFRLAFVTAYGATYNNDVSVNYPSSDHDYHAYNGTVYPISWQTEAGTVYGGYFVVNEDGSLDLTVTWGGKDMGTLTWTYEPAQTRFKSETLAGLTDGANAICSLYKRGSSLNALTDGQFFIGATGNTFVRDSRYTDAADFKAAVAGQTIVYPLAQPVIYRLSAQHITSLLGQNNVWSNTGDTEVTYVADPKLYIAKMLGGGALTLGSASPLSINRPVTINEKDLEQAGEVSEAVEAAAETVLPAESGETEEGAQE